MMYAAITNDNKVAVFGTPELLHRFLGADAPYVEIPTRDYFRCGRKLYAHNGVILTGKTDEEKALIATFQQAEAIKQRLAAIDREAGAGRAVRGLALAAAAKNDIEGRDYENLLAAETRAEALRAELEALGV